MSGSQAKATRRELRRAMGTSGVGAVREVQANHESLANSIALAHRKIDDLLLALKVLQHEKKDL